MNGTDSDLMLSFLSLMDRTTPKHACGSGFNSEWERVVVGSKKAYQGFDEELARIQSGVAANATVATCMCDRICKYA